MAQWNFLDANGLNYYHGLIKTYVDSADALSIKYLTFTPTGSESTGPASISFWKVDPTATGATPAYTVSLPFDDYIEKITGTHTNEVAIITADGQITYSGLLYTNLVRLSGDTGATFTAGQALVFGTDTATGAATVKGIDLAAVATSGAAADVSYSNTIGSTAVTNVDDALDALVSATEGGVASKTVYIANGSSQEYAAVYNIYQGSEGSSATPDPTELIGTINIPKDMMVESGSVVDIVFKASDNTLHEGSESGPDVTEAIKGSGVIPTAADAGKYIKLVLANSGDTALYIKATDLVDIYTGGTTADIVVSISNNVVTATLTQAVQDKLDLASNAVQKGWTTTLPTSGNIASFGSNGVLTDGGIAVSSINTDTFAPIANATIDAIVGGSYTPTT